MKVGDRAFFYHSGEGKEIVGIAEVVKTAYPDPTDKDGKAVTVDFKAVEPVKKPVTLAAIKADPKFKEIEAGAPVAALGVAGQRRALEAPDRRCPRQGQVIDNTRGILAMSASVVVFIFNDALIKLAAESVPSVQAIGVRGLFATLWCALALLATGAWRQIHWAANPRVVFRGVLEAAVGDLLPGRAVPDSVRHRHGGQSVDAARSSPCWRCCC